MRKKDKLTLKPAREGRLGLANLRDALSARCDACRAHKWKRTMQATGRRYSTFLLFSRNKLKWRWLCYILVRFAGVIKGIVGLYINRCAFSFLRETWMRSEREIERERERGSETIAIRGIRKRPSVLCLEFLCVLRVINLSADRWTQPTAWPNGSARTSNSFRPDSLRWQFDERQTTS